MNKVLRFLSPLWVDNVKWHSIAILFVWFITPLSASFTAFSLKNIADALSSWNSATFHNWLIAVVWFSIIMISYVWVAKKSYIEVEQNIDCNLSEYYLRLIIRMKNSYYDNIWSGRMIDIAEWGINAWNWLLMMAILSFSMSFFATIFWMINVYIINKTLFIIAISYLVILILTLIMLNKSLLPIRKDIKVNNTEIVRHFVRSIQTKTDMAMNGTVETEINHIRKYIWKNKILFSKAFLLIESMFTSWRIFTLWLRLTSFLIIWGWILSKTMTTSDLIVVIWTVAIIETTLTYFIDNYKNFLKQYAHVEKLHRTFDEAAYMENYDDGDDFIFKAWNVSIKNLKFAYDENNVVFNDFNIDISWGKRTAFVWKSWSGKTTIIKLILGLLNPNSWTIEIDNQNISDMNLKSVFKHVGYLSQEPAIFDGTIRENMSSVKNDATDEEIEKALSLAECDFISRMKEWINTEIWERGVLLSWGQKQRLAIAKVFLKNPEIVILDEPTSALDSFSEDAITKALHTLMVWRTMIIIAHRLQTVKECDDIVVFGKNEILERWTHEELVQIWKWYKNMLDLQSWIINE